MAYAFKLRERSNYTVTNVNTLVITEDGRWATGDPLMVKVYNPYGTILLDEEIAQDSMTAVPLSEDKHGNAIQGEYRVEFSLGEEEVVHNVKLSYTPINAKINAFADGYRSQFYAYDITTWEGFVSRSMEVVPPAPLDTKSTNGTQIVYNSSIWSGEYTVNLGASYEITTESSTSVFATIEDASFASEVVLVYKLDEGEVLGWVENFMNEYVSNLTANPRKAKADEPKAIQVSLLLHSYTKDVKLGFYKEAYADLEAIRVLVSPDVDIVSLEIIPFVAGDGDNFGHTHNNMATLADFSTEGGVLHWKGAPIVAESDGKVKMSDVGGGSKFLDQHIDSDTIIVETEKLRVSDDYLKTRIGSTLEWDDITKKLDVVSGVGSKSGGGGGVAWTGSVTYPKDEVVSVLTDGDIRFYRSLQINNRGKNPLTEGAWWAHIGISANTHIQNTDYRFSNKIIEVSLGDATSGVLDCPWNTHNNILLTKNDGTSILNALTPKSALTLSDGTLENHDFTIIIDIDHGEVKIVNKAGTGGINFNNKGADLVFSDAYDWARYRYNGATQFFDLVATSLLSGSDDAAVSVDTHLRGDDTTYHRFLTSYKDFSGTNYRTAILKAAGTSAADIKESGLYYSDGWLDYPSGVYGTAGEQVSGWVSVISGLTTGETVLGCVQDWLATGNVHPTMGNTFKAYPYRRVFDGTSWGAWTSSDATMAHGGLTSWAGDLDSSTALPGDVHLTIDQHEKATQFADATHDGLLSFGKYTEFNNKLDNFGTEEGSPLSISSGTLFFDDGLVDHNTLMNYVAAQHTPLDDTSTLTTRVLSASKIYSLIEGTGGSVSTVKLGSGTTMASRAGSGSSVVPAGWSLSASGTELLISHTLGKSVKFISIHAEVGSSMIELRNDVGYTTMTNQKAGVTFDTVKLEGIPLTGDNSERTLHIYLQA